MTTPPNLTRGPGAAGTAAPDPVGRRPGAASALVHGAGTAGNTARRRALAICFIAGAAIGALIGSVALGRGDAPQVDDRQTEIARLTLEHDAAARQLELASGDAFYLVVDPGAQALTLRLGGVVLQQVDLIALSMATPRAVFASRTVPPWVGVVWSGGRLDPVPEREREEIVPPEPGSDAPPPEPPPAPDDPSLLPSSYFVRFDGGFAIELDPDLPPTAAIRFRSVWRRAVQEPIAALGLTRADRVRLKATVPAAQYAAFYRSLPPDVRLIVLPTKPEGV